MNAHRVLLPALLILGTVECAMLNVVASGARTVPVSGRTELAGVPSEPPIAAAPPRVASAGAGGADETPQGKPRPEASGVLEEEIAQPSIRVPFAPRSVRFRPETIAQMRSIVREMKADSSKRVRLVGRSDQHADGAGAEGLGKRRVDEVRAYVEQLGIDAARITSEVQPPTSTSKTEGVGIHAVDAVWH